MAKRIQSYITSLINLITNNLIDVDSSRKKNTKDTECIQIIVLIINFRTDTISFNGQ